MFKRKCNLEDEFGSKIADFIQNTINDEFQWNIFFRILFEIEPDCNAGDLEKFIIFYKERFYRSVNLKNIEKKLEKDQALSIMNELMNKLGDLFIKVNTVELFYDNVIEQIISILNSIVDTISRNISTYEEWEKEREIYLRLFELRISSVLDIDVEALKVLDFLDDVRKSESNIEIHKSIVKYIDKL